MNKPASTISSQLKTSAENIKDADRLDSTITTTIRLPTPQSTTKYPTTISNDNIEGVMQRLAEWDAILMEPVRIVADIKKANEKRTRFKQSLADELFPLLSEAKRMAEDKKSGGQLSLRIQNIEERVERTITDWNIAVMCVSRLNELQEEFTNWLEETEKKVNSHGLGDTVLATAEQITELHELSEIQDSVRDKAGLLRSVIETGTSLEPWMSRYEAHALRTQLSKLNQRWRRLRDLLASKSDRVAASNRQTNVLMTELDEMMKWIDKVQSTAESADDSEAHHLQNSGAVNKQLQRLGYLSNRIHAKRSRYESLCSRIETFKESSTHSELDRAEIQSKLDQMRRSWSTMVSRVDENRRRLEHVLISIGKFTETPDSLRSWLVRTKMLLEVDTPTSGDIETVDKLQRDHRNLEFMLSQRIDSANKLRSSSLSRSRGSGISEVPFSPALSHGSSIGSRLSDLFAESTSSIDSNELDELANQVKSLAKKRAESLSNAHEMAEEFDSAISKLGLWLDAIRNHCNSMFNSVNLVGNPTRIALKRHLNDLEGLIQQIPEKQNDRGKINEIGDRILQRCHPDAIGTVRSQLKSLDSRWNEIVDHTLLTMRDWLNESLSHLDNDISKLADISTWLQELLPKLEQWHQKRDDTAQNSNAAIEAMLQEQMRIESEMAVQMETLKLLPDRLQQRVDYDWNRMVMLVSDRHKILHRITEYRRQVGSDYSYFFFI